MGMPISPGVSDENIADIVNQITCIPGIDQRFADQGNVLPEETSKSCVDSVNVLFASVCCQALFDLILISRCRNQPKTSCYCQFPGMIECERSLPALL